MDPRSLDCGFILGFSFLFIVIGSMLFSVVDFRLFNDSRLNQISNQERIGGYVDSFQSIMARPISGWGIGNYYLSLYAREPYFQSYFYQPVHNVFLLVTAEIGILGGLLLLVFLGIIIWGKMTNFRHNSVPLALIFALLMMAMIDHWLWSLHFGIFFFWLVLGIATWEFEEKSLKF